MTFTLEIQGYKTMSGAFDISPIDTPVNPLDRFGVANMNWAAAWWTIPEYSTWANFPMSCKMCDAGNTTSRGRNIPVSNSLWDFMYGLNDAAGIRFIESVGRLIINRPYIDRRGNYHGADTSTTTDDPANADPQAMAEPIFYPVNPYKIVAETPTHYRVDALRYDIDFSTLDPKIYNWENMPWLFPKMCAESRFGTIQNVMNGIDAFWVTLCQTSGAWIPKELLTLAPDPKNYVINGKRGVGYRVRGANWYMGLEDGSQVTVRSVTKTQGVKEFYNWRLGARSVIPPAWFV